MPVPIKIFAPVRLDFELREAARKSGRTISDTGLKFLEKGMALSPAVDMPEAAVDVAERNGSGSRAVACYLSPPLSKGIERLAAELQRSTSWTMRSLIREGLRARGLLPPTPENAVDAALEVTD